MNWKVLLLGVKMFGLGRECAARRDKSLPLCPLARPYFPFSNNTLEMKSCFFLISLAASEKRKNQSWIYVSPQWRRTRISLTSGDTTRSSASTWLRFRMGRRWLPPSSGSTRTAARPASTMSLWKSPYIKSSRNIQTSEWLNSWKQPWEESHWKVPALDP